MPAKTPPDGALAPKAVPLCAECDSEAGCTALGRCRATILGQRVTINPKTGEVTKTLKKRPKGYTDEIADRICLMLADGEGLNDICKDRDYPAEATVRLWVVDDHNGFAAKYARARDVGIDHRADELRSTSQMALGLPSEGVAAMRLIVDTEKWYLSKIAPKRYGEKIEHTGPGGGAVQIAIVRYGDAP